MITLGMAAVLEILRRRPQGIERLELYQHIGELGPVKKCSVWGMVRRLREWLKTAYVLPDGWDPIREEFQGEVASKLAICPRRLVILSLNIPDPLLAAAECAEPFREWDISHDTGEGKVRRSSRVFLRGAIHQVAFSDATVLEMVKAGEPVPLADVESRFRALGFGPTTVLSAVRDARRFLRRVFELPETVDPLPVTGSPKGPGAQGRGMVTIELPK
ncbi:MAG: hypothetical protein IT428_33015 [Planctomycetaceae bacterium]|nr:hypothetical protein [Planctomycetaceae bacterium]